MKDALVIGLLGAVALAIYYISRFIQNKALQVLDGKNAELKTKQEASEAKIAEIKKEEVKPAETDEEKEKFWTKH